VADNATLALFLMDSRQHCTFMNPAAEAMTGFTLAEVQALGRPLHDIIHHTRPDGRPYPLAECPIDRALPVRNRQTGEDVFVRKDGSFYPVAFTASPIVEDGVPVGTVIEVRDTTEERRVAARIRDRDARLRAALAASAIGTYSRDIAAGRVEHDQGIERLFGLRPGEGASLDDYTARIHPDDRDAWLAVLDGADTEGRDLDMEYRVIRPDGSRRVLRDKGTVFRDAAGRPYFIVGAVVDVTERHEAERRTEEFLAMLAHELRNPLAPLLASTQLLRRLHRDHAPSQKPLEIMERQTRHLSRLVDDLLEVSRISRGRIELHREPVVLQPLLAQAMEATRAAAGAKGLHCRLDLATEPLTVLGDPVRLTQVVTNLLSNAVKFTPTPGEVHLTLAREDDAAVVRVRDTGIGVEPDARERVFELFAQESPGIDRGQGGLGIGLTLVRRLVTMHDGTVTLRSAGRDRGTEVVVRLPLTQAEPLPADATNGAVGTAGTARGLRVVVVEDNADAADSLAALLRADGHVVWIERDGHAGLDRIRSIRPDVACVDLGLPTLDGLEIARRVRREPALAGVRLIAVSGYGREEDKRQAREAGFDGHLTKPAEHDAIQRRLAEVTPRPPAA
jgi:two-component system CheB/CheR fusion protein